MTTDVATAIKPLGGRAYGSIGHLPGSRRGPGDHGLNPGQDRICTVQARDRHDLIIVQVKLDGSNVAVARLDGALIPLVRAGYVATKSSFEQHHLFAAWVRQNDVQKRLRRVIQEGEWLSGEWLAQAHGTRYDLTGREPFYAFDIWQQDATNKWRLPFMELLNRGLPSYFAMPATVHIGGPLSVEEAMRRVNVRLHGELEEPEGAVWRVERAGSVDFLAKWVRGDKVDGKYLNGPAIWNWRPSKEPVVVE